MAASTIEILVVMSHYLRSQFADVTRHGDLDGHSSH
jgi:hypothetical protein